MLDLLSVYRAAVHAVKPNSLIRSAIEIDHSGWLNVVEKQAKRKHRVKLANRDVYLFGAGKAILGMAEEFLQQVDRFNQHGSNAVKVQLGRLNVPHGSRLTHDESTNLFAKYNVTFHECGRNNLPDAESCRNTQAIVDLIDQEARQSISDPLLVAFISGGGSALLALPKPPVTLDDKQNLIHRLVTSGANIVELNTVRGAISLVKHGKVAQKALESNCELVTFIISDIIDDPIEKIASGPTVPQTGGLKARDVLAKYQIEVNESIEKAIDDSSTVTIRSHEDRIRNLIIGNNFIALDAAAEEAKRAGFKVINCGSNLAGEALQVVQRLLAQVNQYQVTSSDCQDYRGICWLGGGETTISMNNKDIGLGGRCQEMGLLWLRELARNPLASKLCSLSALFAGTDGQDGPTPVAGVQLHFPTRLDLDEIEKAIERHDSYHFYRKHAPSCLIQTGVSGTNVMDVYCISYCF